MKQVIFLVVALATAATAAGQEWEGDLLGVQGGVDATLGVSWESKYLWRGFDIYDDTSVTHILADVSLGDSGFGMSAVGHRANSSGFEDGERWDYTLYYQNGIFSGEPYATNYRVGWVYYNFPEFWSEEMDLQEGQAVFSWPNLLPIKGLCPSYVVAKLWPSRGDSFHADAASGWWHILMLDYGFTVPGVIPEIPEHLIKLHGELVYNGGVSPLNGQLNRGEGRLYTNPDHDFSNVVVGASTDLYFGKGKNITVTPSIYYQHAMESTVNRDSDEIWAGVSLKYTF